MLATVHYQLPYTYRGEGREEREVNVQIDDSIVKRKTQQLALF